MSCTKKRYPDKRTAASMKNLLERTRHGRKGDAKHLRIYHCKWCDAWHLTKQRQRKPRYTARNTVRERMKNWWKRWKAYQAAESLESMTVR